MRSDFKNIVISQIGGRSNEIEKNIYKYEQILESMEQRIDKGQIKTNADAMKLLRSHFRYNLTNEDYRKIQKQLSYKLK